MAYLIRLSENGKYKPETFTLAEAFNVISQGPSNVTWEELLTIKVRLRIERQSW